MRMVLAGLLLSGCSALDSVADGRAANLNRVYLGGDEIILARREEMTRYTCGDQQLICDSVGAKWVCSCSKFSLARF